MAQPHPERSLPRGSSPGPPEPLVLPADVRPRDVPALVAGAEVALGRAVGPELRCKAMGEDRPTLATVDLLARLALVARRHGVAIRLEHASPELVGLLSLCGFDGLIPCDRPDEDQARETTAPAVRDDARPRDEGRPD